MKRIQALLVLLAVFLVSVSHAQQDNTEPTKVLLEAAEYPEDPEAFDAALEALAAGADVNGKDLGLTVLIIATKYCNPKLVQLLLERGADIEGRDNSGETALMFAAKKGSPFPSREGRPGYTKILKSLLKKGARINAQDDDGKTALYYAATYGHADHVKILLAKGADVNIVGYEVTWTPLIAASYAGHTEVVRLLLEAGADISLKDRDRQTALSYALQRGHKEIAGLISSSAAGNPRRSEAGARASDQHTHRETPAAGSSPAVTEKPCYLCNGGGACNWCYGSGRGSFGNYECVKCYGSGRCTNCGGSGRVRNQ